MGLSTETWAVRLHQHGDTSVLRHERVAVPPPEASEAQIALGAAGVNFVDIYQRQGLYPIALPAVLGNEGAGEVVSVGKDVSTVKHGDRVGFCSTGVGSYAGLLNVAAKDLIKLPANIDFALAAAILLKGLTAECLARRCWPVRTGDRVVVTAAAGGVGQLLCQMLALLGADVIAVVGSSAKRARAEAVGCPQVLVGYHDLAKRVRQIVPAGVAAVFDSIGHDTFAGALDSLAPRGCLISYGNASGPAPTIRPLDLASRGSLFLTRPLLWHYLASRAELRSAASNLFGFLDRGMHAPPITSWPLAAAAAAHQALEGRKLAGVAILQPLSLS